MRKYLILSSAFILINCETNYNDKNANIISSKKEDSIGINNLYPADAGNVSDEIVETKSDNKKSNVLAADSFREPSSIEFKAPDLSGKGPQIRTYAVGTNGWGYDILVNGKVFITQANIPAINGNIPFSSSHDAEQVARLMVFKMKSNINPPSVSIKELDSLNIKR